MRITIKVGSHVLTKKDGVAIERLRSLVGLIVRLKDAGYEVMLVSSGAVAAGYTLLQLDRSSVANKQALAAIGQPLLMKYYQEEFLKHQLICSQVLLSADVFEQEEHISHAKEAIDTLLDKGVVPIINENDTVSIEELIFGDNDRLSAHVTHHFDAQLLVILSDIDAYYDKDPHKYSDAKALRRVEEIPQEALEASHTPNHDFATGGIVTKLQAADYLLKHNKRMFLASGFELGDVKSFLLEKKQLGGTLFAKNKEG